MRGALEGPHIRAIGQRTAARKLILPASDSRMEVYKSKCAVLQKIKDEGFFIVKENEASASIQISTVSTAAYWIDAGVRHPML